MNPAIKLYRQRPTRLSVALAVCTLTLTACQTTPLQSQSQVSYPANYQQTQTQSNSQLPDLPATDIRQWWQHFGDPVLNQLIDEGLRHAPELRQAEQQLSVARHTARLANADLGPVIAATAGGSLFQGKLDNPLPDNIRQPISQLGSELGQKDFDIDGHSHHLGLIASWEPDLFGKKKSDADAAGFAYLAVQEKTHAAQMLLTASIAQHYLQARSLEQQARLLANTQAALADLQRYAQARFNLGQATRYDVDDIGIKLAAIKAQQTTLQAQADDHSRQIAVLIGRTPQQFTLPAASSNVFAQLPAAPQGQQPSELLSKRPDIRAQQARIYALAANHASAQADLFPRFSLNFGILSGRLSIGDSGLDGLSGNTGLVSANLHLPLFTNGRIRLNIAAADAQVQAAMAEYDKTLLTALQQVDSSYAMYHALREQHQRLTTATDTANTQVANSQKLFDYGRLTFDNIPTAQITANDMQLNQLNNELLQGLNLIGLYQSLGGGWQVRENAGVE